MKRFIVAALLLVAVLAEALANESYTPAARKTRRRSNINSFQFLEMSDGCLIDVNSRHYEQRYDIGSRATIGTGLRGIVQQGADQSVHQIHRNDNRAINSWISQFERNVARSGAKDSSYDDMLFNEREIGNRYYIYSISEERTTLGGEPATLYAYRLQRVDIVSESEAQGSSFAFPWMGSGNYSLGFSVGISLPVSERICDDRPANVGVSLSLESSYGPWFFMIQGDWYSFQAQSLLANVAIGRQLTSLFGVYAGGGLGTGSYSARMFSFDDPFIAWKVFAGARLMLGRVLLRADISYVRESGVMIGAHAGLMF